MKLCGYIFLIIWVLNQVSNANASFSFNDEIFASGSNHMKIPNEENPQNYDFRLDNRFITSYQNDNFKSEFHLLTSVQNHSTPDYQIPVVLVVEDDKYSLLNLTAVSSNNNLYMVNKIDRLNISYFNNYVDITLGRTALTWSRGRIFHVTDFFNPQSPGFYDGTYKMGTDMLYTNFSLGDAGSLSFVANPKRNHTTLEVEAQDSTFATRYLYSNNLIDVSFMVAQYLRDKTIATGISSDFIFGSVIRSDVSLWQPEYDKTNLELMYVISLERSLEIFTKTSSIFVEYFHNDFGYKGQSNLALANLNPTMKSRFEEQDTYLIGKDYLAIGFTIELSQYIMASYSNTLNLYDYSSFNSLSLSYSATENLSVATNLTLPMGGLNEEFGKQCGINGDPNNCFELNPMIMLSLSYNF